MYFEFIQCLESSKKIKVKRMVSFKNILLFLPNEDVPAIHKRNVDIELSCTDSLGFLRAFGNIFHDELVCLGVSISDYSVCLEVLRRPGHHVPVDNVKPNTIVLLVHNTEILLPKKQCKEKCDEEGICIRARGCAEDTFAFGGVDADFIGEVFPELNFSTYIHEIFT